MHRRLTRAALGSLGLTLAVVPTALDRAQAAPDTTAPDTTQVMAASAATRPAFQMPFPCGTTWRVNTWGHSPAVDIVREPQSSTRGSTVVASAAGTVKEAGSQTGSGNYVLINHGGGWYTVMIHLRDTPLVKAGQQVAAGQAVGKVGSSGTLSNGVDHLHYEQLVDADGNGYLEWGVSGGEDVAITFGSRTYTGSGGEWRNVASANACGTTPPLPSTPTKVDVTTFADAPGYPSPTSTSSTGTLRQGVNYVYCKVAGRRITDSAGNTNKWWLRTDLDTGSTWRNQYVSAYYLAKWGNDEAKDDAGRVIANC